MAASRNKRAVRWLRGELPVLVQSGLINAEAARAIERHYAETEEESSNFGFIVLATIGAILIGAGIILLIAHNWDELSRPTRTVLALLPLVLAHALGLFVLLRRDESVPWRESVAVFDLAGVAAAIALISQTFQILGSFSDFMKIWLLLCLPIVYLFRGDIAAIVFMLGTTLFAWTSDNWLHPSSNALLAWVWLGLILPFLIWRYRRDGSTAFVSTLFIFLALASAVTLGLTSERARSNLGLVSFSGLAATVYLCGMKFFPAEENDRVRALSLIGGIAASIIAIVGTFEDVWHMHGPSQWPGAFAGTTRNMAIALQLLLPTVALVMMAEIFLRRRRVLFSIAIALLPLVAAIAWGIIHLAPMAQRGTDSGYSLAASIIFDVFALGLGLELLLRGVRAQSLPRSNFGLLVLAALALARFFDSDLDFVTRGLAFIVVGAGFLGANIIWFRRRASA